jgi:hypothetical protein
MIQYNRQPMMRPLLAILSIVSLSLLLCLGFRYFMVGCHRIWPELPGAQRNYHLIHRDGTEALQITSGMPGQPAPKQHAFYVSGPLSSEGPIRQGTLFGIIEWASQQQVSGVRIQTLIVPSWLLMTLTAIAPTIWAYTDIRRVRVRRLGQDRIRRGLCVYCGYDLRASSECCPECGTAIPARPVSACSS